MGAREMDGLIVRHLVDIEVAGKRAYVLEAEVFKVFGKIAEKWANKTDWQGTFDIEEEFWLAPVKWKLGGETEEKEENWLAYFEFGVGADDDINEETTDFFKLTRLCQARNGKYGF